MGGGRGSLAEYGVAPKEVSLLSCPLGKAFGGYGAMLLGSNEQIESIVQEARAYRYSTALPPTVVAGVLAALDLIQTEPERVARLRENIFMLP